MVNIRFLEFVSYNSIRNIWLYFPGFFYEFLLLGAIWELFEDFYASDQNTQLIDCDKCCRGCPGSKTCGGKCENFNQWNNPVEMFRPIAKKIWCGRGNATDNYWYGKANDILANSVGYLIGEYMATGKISIMN